MGDLTAVLVAVVLLALNAFFVGAEFALISARRSQIEPLAEAGSAMARSTLRAMERVSVVMAGAQFGITVCSLGLGAVGEPAVAHLVEPDAALAAAAVRVRAVVPDLRHPVWTPHVTLARRVPRTVLPDVLDVLHATANPDELLCDRLRWWDPEQGTIQDVAFASD